MGWETMDCKLPEWFDYIEKCLVEVSVSGSELARMDLFSKSDPFVVAYKGMDEDWKEIGRTETLWDNSEPRFVEKFIVKPTKQTVETLRLRFAVYDRDTKTTEDLSRHDVIGYAECSLFEILLVDDRSLKLRLENSQLRKKAGFLTVTAELRRPIAHPRAVVLQIAFGPLFDNKQSKVFYEISRMNAPGLWPVLYRSEQIRLNKLQRFDDAVIDEEDLTAGNERKKLRLEVFRVKKLPQKVESLGSIIFYLEELESVIPGSLFKFIEDPDTNLEQRGARQAALFDSEVERNSIRFQLRLQNF